MGDKKKLILIVITIIILLAIIIPEVKYQEMDELPVEAERGIRTLVEHSVEKVLIVGYKVVEEDTTDELYNIFHVKAYTAFGLTYADIYITTEKDGDISGGSIDRRIFFRE